MISEIRFAGTSSRRASSLALTPTSFSSSARISPGWMGGLDIGFTLLVVVDDLDIRRSRRPRGPFEADPPLHVDADAELSLAVAVQRLEAVARQGPQIFEAGGGVENLQ